MNRVKELRKQRNMTQEELGKVLDIQKAAISKYENGRAEPSTDVLKKMSAFFGVSIDYLLGNSSDPSQESGGYYSDPEVAQMAEELRTDPDKRILFDATKDLSKDDIDTVLKIIEGLKAREKE
ncbi:helix-turn-helix domain-containing protein [Megasphaera hexanoica]|uniref:Helix-turn-helix domain-containing protein n=1 Tax=Megasphaera hexanoica TaxID=1675036 RepID=A0ABW7DSC5_9FIRM|nr:helix-turn-helix domain-containing protein [Megasphaera hexanoica]